MCGVGGSHGEVCRPAVGASRADPWPLYCLGLARVCLVAGGGRALVVVLQLAVGRVPGALAASVRMETRGCAVGGLHGRPCPAW